MTRWSTVIFTAFVFLISASSYDEETPGYNRGKHKISSFVSTSGSPPEVPVPSASRKEISVTIYNQDLAVVREIREIDLPGGIVYLRFEDVSAQIDPTSLSVVSLTAPEAITLLEQNYEYDLVNPQKLLQKYLGKEIVIARQDGTGKEILVPAILLSTEGEGVYKVGERIELGANGRIILPELPEGLRIRPTLLWLFDSTRALRHRLDVSYITHGLSWEANYVAIVNQDDTKMDLTGWVTLNNRSGAAYENATLKLVAGEVERVEEAQYAKMLTLETRRKPEFSEETFFEYHLYTLERRTSLRDRETKQITLLTGSGIRTDKKYIVWGQRHYYDNFANTEKQKLPIGVYLEFENSEQNGLGIPLPKGIFRVYKKDASGAEQFIGEDHIEHTPKNESIRLKVGNAFDIVAERVQTDYRAVSKNIHEYAFSIEFRNHKEEAIVIEALEPVWGDWEILSSSHTAQKVSASLIRFKVAVPANGSSTLNYRIRVRW
ncbi:MAG: DUF4139 domain-containing protein [bacterium JZ-2024 1]